MSVRVCTACGTKLPGRLGHGMPTSSGGLLCGRREVERSVRGEDGRLSLVKVRTPECSR